MTMELVQHGVVTAVAMAAAAVLFRRVVAFVGPSSAAGGCSSCPSRPHRCASAEQQAAAPASTGPVPIQLLRRSPAPHPADRTSASGV
jgi:hypothetical protein